MRFEKGHYNPSRHHGHSLHAGRLPKGSAAMIVFFDLPFARSFVCFGSFAFSSHFPGSESTWTYSVTGQSYLEPRFPTLAAPIAIEKHAGTEWLRFTALQNKQPELVACAEDCEYVGWKFRKETSGEVRKYKDSMWHKSRHIVDVAIDLLAPFSSPPPTSRRDRVDRAVLKSIVIEMLRLLRVQIINRSSTLDTFFRVRSFPFILLFSTNAFP